MRTFAKIYAGTIDNVTNLFAASEAIVLSTVNDCVIKSVCVSGIASDDTTEYSIDGGVMGVIQVDISSIVADREGVFNHPDIILFDDKKTVDCNIRVRTNRDINVSLEWRKKAVAANNVNVTLGVFITYEEKEFVL